MEYKHFSHPHSLRIYQVQEEDDEIQCSGCESICLGSVYGCWACKYFLHQQCGDAARSLQHPSHPTHHLTLLPSPTYPDGSFLCNACGATGTAFCFCCASCDVDLHVHCALLPQEIELTTHRHKLSLAFSQPEDLVTPTVCNSCRLAVDDRYWNYSCFSCNFHVHTHCATSKLQAGAEHSETGNMSRVSKEEANYTIFPNGDMRNDQYGRFGVGNLPPFTAEEADYTSVSNGAVRDQYGRLGVGNVSGVNQLGCNYGPAVEPVVIEDPILKAQAELHELQMQMQIANEMAKMMASFNLSSLV